MRSESKRWKERDQNDIEKAEEMQASGVSTRGLPASKRYKVDPRYSRRETAFCGVVLDMGMCPCKFAEGKLCYSRKVCSSMMSLEDPTKRYKEAEELYKQEKAAALHHAHDVMKRVPDETSMSDEEYEELVRRIIGE